MYEHPYLSAEAVAPHDTNQTVSGETSALYIGTAGTLAVVMRNGATVSFGAVAAGTLLPIAVSRVKATGTSASNIVALYR